MRRTELRRKRLAGGASDAASDLLFIFLLGAAFRVVLLFLFPAPYGEDGFGRVFFKDHIFLSHWLPLAQCIVYLTARLWDGILAVRLVFAMLGSLAACGFYLFLRLLVDRRAAFFGGILFSLNALFVILSLMPYQDVLFLGLYYAGLAFLFEGGREGNSGAQILQSKRGALLYGLASLTRYESWFALPVIGLWKTRLDSRRKGWILGAVGAALFFGWAPLVWFLLSQWRFQSWNGFLFQTPDRQFYGWHPHLDLWWAAGYLLRWLYWIALFGSPLALLAAAGLAEVIRRPRKAHPALRFLFVNGALAAGFFFFIIGKEQDTVFRFVMFALSIVLVLTVIGVDATLSLLSQVGPFRRWAARPVRLAALALVTIGLMVYAAIPVARLDARPENRDPFEIAAFLERNLSGGQRALVVADRSRDLHDAAPLLYQRIVAQCRLPRDAVRSSGLIESKSRDQFIQYGKQFNIQYLIIFEKFKPWLPSDIFFAGLPQLKGARLKTELELETAKIYRIEEWPQP